MMIYLLKKWKDEQSPRAKRDAKKIEILLTTINYMESRIDMMNYKEYINEDLPIASGIVENTSDLSVSRVSTSIVKYT